MTDVHQDLTYHRTTDAEDAAAALVVAVEAASAVDAVAASAVAVDSVETAVVAVASADAAVAVDSVVTAVVAVDVVDVVASPLVPLLQQIKDLCKPSKAKR